MILPGEGVNLMRLKDGQKFYLAIFLVFIASSISGQRNVCLAAGVRERHAPSQDDASNKGREILAKTVIAMGGSEKLVSIENFRVRTEGVLFPPQSGTEIKLSLTETIAFPNKTKQVFDMPQGRRIQVLNDQDSWFKIGKELGDLTDSQIREMKRGLFRVTINLLKKLDDEELRVEYISEEMLAGKTNHVIRIKDLTGDFIDLYIDATNHLVQKKTYRGASEVGLAILEETYSDFRKIQGITIPFETVVRANGKKFIENSVIEAEFNIKLDQGFFHPN